MWLYKGKEFTSEMIGDYVGFVYLITNKTTGMKYIGQKRFKVVKRYQKNKKTKRKKVESDWSSYTGSNAVLNEHVSEGHDLQKEILHLCTGLGWMNYYETKEIIDRNALQDNNYYNEWIRVRINRSHLK